MRTWSEQRLSEEALVLLGESFNRHELRVLLRFRLHLRIFDLPGASPENDDSALRLAVVNYVQEAKRLEELIRAAALERPQDTRWERLASKTPAHPDDVFAKTLELILDSFGQQDFEQMLRFKLSLRMQEITNSYNGFSADAFEVIDWFVRRGSLCQLICAAAAERPNVSAWRSLWADHCEELPLRKPCS